MQVDILVYSVPADGNWDVRAPGSPGGYSGGGHPDDAVQLLLRPGSPADNPGRARVVGAGAGARNGEDARSASLWSRSWKYASHLGIERVGVPLDLNVALRFDLLLYAQDLLAGRRISEPPGLSLPMGKVAVGDPAPGLVRMAALSPAIQAPPHEAVQLGEALATEDIAMIVRPATEEGVEGIDELF